MVIEADEFGEQQEMDEVEQENGSGNSEEEEEEEEVPQIRRQQGQIRMVTSIENAQMREESVPPSAAGTDAAQPAQQQAAPQSPAPAAAAPKSPAPTQSAAPASPAPATAAPKSPAPTQSAAPASPAPTQTAAPASPAPAAVVPQSPGAAQQTSLEEAKRRQQEAMEKARAEALRMQEEARAKAEAARQQHQQQAAEQAKLQAEQQLKAQQEAAKRQAEERAQQLKAQQQQQQKQTVQVQQQQQQETSPSVTAPQQKKAPATAAAAAPAPQQPTKAPEQPKQQQAKPAVAADAQKAAPVQQQQQPKSAAVAQQPKAAAAAPKPTAPPPTAAQTRAPPPVVREVQLPEAPSKPILRHAEYTPKLVDSSVNKLPPGQEPEEEQVEPSSVPRNPAIEDNAWQVQRRVQPEYQPVQPGKLNATGEFLVESEAQKSIVPEAVGYSKVQWNEFPEEEEKEQQTVPKVKAQEWVPEHDVEHHVQKTVYQPGRIGPDPNTGRLWPPPGYGEEEQTEIGKGEKTKCIADNGWIMSNGAEPAEDDGEVGNAPWKAHTRGGDVKNRQWPPEENAAEKEMAKGGRIGAQWPPPEQEEMEQQRVEILQTHIPVKDKVREWKPRSLFPQFEETETTEEGA